MDRTLEKIELAKELGLENYYQPRIDNIQALKEIRKFTEMNFRPITYTEIENKIGAGKWHFEKPNFFLLGTPVVCLLVRLKYMFVHNEQYSVEMWLLTVIFTGIAFLLPFAILGTRGFIYIIDTASMDLSNWKDELPYGALLAVKEAKEKGLDEFRIYYPIKYVDRVMADPVITGKDKKNTEYEVFSWDDGKVYE